MYRAIALAFLLAAAGAPAADRDVPVNTPPAMRSSHTRVAGDVFTRLAAADALWNVTVRETLPGQVTLSGTVPDDSAKRRA